MATSSFVHLLIVYIPTIAVIVLASWLYRLSRKPTQSNLVSFLLHQRLGKPPAPGWQSTLFGPLLDLTWGEFLFFSTPIVVLIIRFSLYYNDFPVWSKGFRFSNVDARFFRSLGELNFVTLGFVTLPVTKHSIWAPLLGLSYERATKFHRWWGYLTVWIMGIHGFGMWEAFLNSSKADGALRDSDFAFKMSIDSKTNWSNLSGFLAWLCFFIMMVTAALIRRAKWEYFRSIHLLLVVPGYIFAGLHMPSLLGWMVPALLLYFLGLLYGFVKVSQSVDVDSMTPLPGDITQITLRKKDGSVFEFEAGQFVLLGVTSLDFHPHPFSISCAPGSNTITLHVKSMGEGTFTGKLHEIALKLQNGELKDPPEMSISTIRGKITLDLQQYPVNVLVCGGVGVTPCASLLADAVRRHQQPANIAEADPRGLPKTYFVWAVQHPSFLSWFPQLMQQAAELSRGNAGANKLSLMVHHTQGKRGQDQPEENPAPIRCLPGRPDFRALLKQILAEVEPGVPIAVFTCGPAPMVAQLQSVCHDEGIDRVHFHKETFEM